MITMEKKTIALYVVGILIIVLSIIAVIIILANWIGGIFEVLYQNLLLWWNSLPTTQLWNDVSITYADWMNSFNIWLGDLWNNMGVQLDGVKTNAEALVEGITNTISNTVTGISDFFNNIFSRLPWMN